MSCRISQSANRWMRRSLRLKICRTLNGRAPRSPNNKQSAAKSRSTSWPHWSSSWTSRLKLFFRLPIRSSKLTNRSSSGTGHWRTRGPNYSSKTINSLRLVSSTSTSRLTTNTLGRCTSYLRAVWSLKSRNSTMRSGRQCLIVLQRSSLPKVSPLCRATRINWLRRAC